MKLKNDINIVKNCSNAFIAGLLIGLGVIINVQTKPPILGSFLFSFGLLTIIYLKLPLYTGKIGFIKQFSLTELLSFICLNFIGIGITVTLYCLNNPQFEELLQAAAATKFSKTYFQMLVGGIFCGILIHFAVKCKVSYLTSMAVIIFILIGAEHCIADFPYFLYVMSFDNLIKLLFVVLGNSLGAIFIEEMIIE